MNDPKDIEPREPNTLEEAAGADERELGPVDLMNTEGGEREPNTVREPNTEAA